MLMRKRQKYHMSMGINWAFHSIEARQFTRNRANVLRFWVAHAVQFYLHRYHVHQLHWNRDRSVQTSALLLCFPMPHVLLSVIFHSDEAIFSFVFFGIFAASLIEFVKDGSVNGYRWNVCMIFCGTKEEWDWNWNIWIKRKCLKYHSSRCW